MVKKKATKRRKNGRATVLSAKVSGIICENVRRGNFLNASASAAGISYATVNEWRKRGEGRHPTREKTSHTAKFAKALREAEDYLQRELIGLLEENCFGYKLTKTEIIDVAGVQTKKITVTETRDPRSLIEFLKIRFPGLFKPEQVEHDHKHSHSGEITVLSPEDQQIASRIMSSRLGVSRN